jgi:hypothetical protein
MHAHTDGREEERRAGGKKRSDEAWVSVSGGSARKRGEREMGWSERKNRCGKYRGERDVNSETLNVEKAG